MEFVQDIEIFNLFGDILECVCPNFFTADIFQNCFRIFWFVPKVSLVCD